MGTFSLHDVENDSKTEDKKDCCGESEGAAFIQFPLVMVAVTLNLPKVSRECRDHGV